MNNTIIPEIKFKTMVITRFEEEQIKRFESM